MNILIANIGSTSFKFQLFDSASLQELARGRLERIGSETAPVQFQVVGKEEVEQSVALPDFGSAILHSIQLLTDPDIGVIHHLSEIAAVGRPLAAGRALLGRDGLGHERDRRE